MEIAPPSASCNLSRIHDANLRIEIQLTQGSHSLDGHSSMFHVPRNSMSLDAIKDQLDQFRVDFQKLRQEIGKVIVGQDEIVEGTLGALIAGGHVLLEGVPGLGKTLLVRTIADVLHLKFARVQFTPDLMPADLVGTNVV